MTIEELLDMDVTKLEAMSDEELTSYLAPYFEVTQPTIEKIEKKSQVKKRLEKNDPDLEKVKELARSLGFDASLLDT